MNVSVGAHLRSSPFPGLSLSPGSGRGGTRHQTTCSKVVRFVSFEPGYKKLGRCPDRSFVGLKFLLLPGKAVNDSLEVRRCEGEEFPHSMET